MASSQRNRQNRLLLARLNLSSRHSWVTIRDLRLMKRATSECLGSCRRMPSVKLTLANLLARTRITGKTGITLLRLMTRETLSKILRQEKYCPVIPSSHRDRARHQLRFQVARKRLLRLSLELKERPMETGTVQIQREA